MMHDHAHDILGNAASIADMMKMLFYLSFISGVVGPFVQITRSNSMVGSVSHSLLFALGLSAIAAINVYISLFLVAVFAGLVIGWIKLMRPDQSDPITNIIWVVGMSLGVLLLGATDSSTEEVLHFMFGSLETVSRTDISIALWVFVLVVWSLLLARDTLLSVVIDPIGARLKGLPVKTLYLSLMVLISVCIVVMVKAIGIVLLIAFLTLPAAIAGRLVLSFKIRAVAAVGVSLTASGVGLLLYKSWGVSPSASIALFLSIVYLLVVVFNPLTKRGFND